MKRLTKVKIFVDRIFNFIFKVDNIEKVNEGLSRQKESLKKLSQSYYNALGSLDTMKSELDKNQENQKRLNKCFDICKGKDNKEEAKQVYEEINATNMRINVLVEQIEKQKLIVQRFKEAKERYEKEIRNLENNLETMKSKAKFSKAVKEYSDNFGEFQEFNIDDIQRDIDNEFNSSNAQLKDENTKVDLNKIETESNFEEMWGK